MSWPSIDDGVPAEGAPAARELLQVVLPHRRRGSGRGALTSVMPHRLSRPSMRGDLGRLPDRAFGRLAVAEQAVGAVVGLDAARVQRDADRGADALAERSGGDVDERQPRRRMPFEVRVDLAAASAARRDRTRRPRPTRRTAAAPRGLSRARSGRCPGAAGPSDRTASRRRTAPPRDRPPSSSWSDVRCRPRRSSAPSRSEAGWRCSSGRG